MPQKNRKRDERKRQIFDVIMEAEKPLSRREICEAIGLKKSPHITDIIEELVTERHVIKLQDMMPNGSIIYVYVNPKLLN